MKILQIGMGNMAGGLEAFVMNYYRVLAVMDVEFDFLCMYPKIAYEEEILRLGGHVFYVPNVKKDYFGYIKGLKKILDNGRYTAVHVNMLSAANIVPLRVASRYPGLHVIAHSHNSSCPGFVRNMMDRVNKRKLPRFATDYFTCSPAAGTWMFGKQMQESGKVHKICNAVRLSDYSFSAQERKFFRDEFMWQDKLVIGHVGRFELQKNHTGMIGIFEELVKKEPDAVLCLIGSKDCLYPEILQLVREKGLEDNVYFTGARSDVGRLLSAMDVFLFPSLFEGAPFALVEAQANGLPCVISNVISSETDVLPEQIRRLPLEDAPQKWAEAVLDAAKTGRAEQERIETKMAECHFDISTEAERLKKIYQDMES